MRNSPTTANSQRPRTCSTCANATSARICASSDDAGLVRHRRVFWLDEVPKGYASQCPAFKPTGGA